MITGNKGEWSEIYTLFKLLGDGVVYAGDADMNRISTLFYPIISVIRQEEQRMKYDPEAKSRVVLVYADDKEVMRVPMDNFAKKAVELLDKIKKAEGRSFSFSSIEDFMNSVMCYTLKAKSSDKTDIKLVVHDLRTGTRPVLGFSIKSQLGSSSTLLNPSDATLFTYKVVGDKPISDEDIERLNAIESEGDRLKEMMLTGYRLDYHATDHETFENNLMVVDSFMPQIIAQALANHYTFGINGIDDSIRIIADANPVGYKVKDIENFYRIKFKNLLVNVALGMTPAKEWDGRYEANGGYLVVKKDGDIVCYHFYDRNQLEDYLIKNTNFDNPSRSRYHYGSIYRDRDGKAYLKLCLQIRFK